MKHAFVIKPNSTLKDAVQALDEGGIGFVAFVDEFCELKGILTDGDLRRAILRNEHSLDSVINKKPVTMLCDAHPESISTMLRRMHRRHMPLVDKNNILKSVFSLDDVEFISKDNIVVIMAGGLGSRLGDLTINTPKPMLVVGDRPMLQHLVEQFRDQGFYKFLFCLNYKKEVIQSHFGDGGEFGVKIDYVVENKRLGTAGALSLIDRTLLNEPFFVINADVLTNFDFSQLLDFHSLKNCMATMCVRKYEYQVPYGVVYSGADSVITSINEKPSLSFDVNAGIYVLQPEALEYIPEGGFYDMPTLFESLMDREFSCATLRLNDYWVDIGKVEDLQKATEDLMSYKCV
ncbi:MAG: nucleotidyltransferase family protein [Cycloclasticus sp.]|nr:nucleotidyltransferase family protein [Cycloclasticus sp.]